MADNLLKHPKNVKQMALNLRDLCDMYWKKAISLEGFEKTLQFYLNNHSEKIFFDGDFRKTLKVLLGKERIKLLTFYAEKNNFKGGVE